jgi:hypothetical protein
MRVTRSAARHLSSRYCRFRCHAHFTLMLLHDIFAAAISPICADAIFMMLFLRFFAISLS